MIYIDSNEKLADLLEKLVNKDPNAMAMMDAKELIVELRSSQGEVSLYDKDAFSKKYNKYKAENEARSNDRDYFAACGVTNSILNN